jgi:hypothetical protein
LLPVVAACRPRSKRGRVRDALLRAVHACAAAEAAQQAAALPHLHSTEADLRTSENAP